jgi:ring-1,2-phenylacetyl-CoA epoxidase subunit PaaC
MVAYGRAPDGFRHAQLVERPRGDWSYSVTRQFLYDTADYVRMESLRQSAYAPLARAASSIIREEKYHLLHAHTWLQRLAEGGPTARDRQLEAFEALWPDALALFEPPMGEIALVAAGILPPTFATLQQHWITQLEEPLIRFDLPFPFAKHGDAWETQIKPQTGGRRGEHSQHFFALYATITSVYRLDPQAKW